MEEIIARLKAEIIELKAYLKQMDDNRLRLGKDGSETEAEKYRVKDEISTKERVLAQYQDTGKSQ
jgi:hypothetical protein